jgi:hypothetical protein
MIEIGVWKGENAARILAARPDVTYTGVDAWATGLDATWEGSESYADSGAVTANLPQSHYDDVHAMCMRRLEKFSARVHIIRMASVEAAEQIRLVADLVFIDADHSYEGVRADIAAWLPRVVKGGWIGGHDFGPRFIGVQQAVVEAFGDHDHMIDLGANETWWHKVSS